MPTLKFGPNFRPKVLICVVENGVEGRLCFSGES